MGSELLDGLVEICGSEVVKGPWSVTGMLSSLGLGSAGVSSLSAVTALVGFSELEGIAARAMFVARSFVVF